MDASRFDQLLRTLAQTPPRRDALRLLTGFALGGLLTARTLQAGARKKKKSTLCLNGQTIKAAKKKKKKALLRQGATVGACPPPPTCSDGITNGNETDVDCGGTCPRCGDDKRCASGADCLSGFCTGRCQRCSTSPNNCNPDAIGPCFCRAAQDGNICVRSSSLADSCAECPAGTALCEPVGLASGFLCFPPCGSA